MEKSCGIYFRGDDVYVSASSQTTVGFLIDTEPRFKLKKTDSPSALGSAVMNALNGSRVGVPTPSDLRYVGDELLKFVGFRSLSSFEKAAIYFHISMTGTGINIVPSTRGRTGGFDFQPRSAVDCGPGLDEIGETLLKMVDERQSI